MCFIYSWFLLRSFSFEIFCKSRFSFLHRSHIDQKNHIDIIIFMKPNPFLRILDRVIVKSGVQAFQSNGGLVDFCHLDSIFEFDPGYDLRQVLETA